MILALETSAQVASVAVVGLEGMVGELTLNHGRTHSQKLMPAVLQLLEQLELKVADLAGIAVSAGPGSFTGIRIGMATAKGLAHGAGIPVLPVSTLEALGWNLAGCPVRVCPIMDARRDQLYTALFQAGGGQLERLWEDDALSVTELAARIRESGEAVWFVGDGVFRFREQLMELLGPLAQFPAKHLWLQRGSSVGMAALVCDSQGVPYRDAVPNYIRKSQAERMHHERIQPE